MVKSSYNTDNLQIYNTDKFTIYLLSY